ncbi:MAG: phytanoyl-CoA dioxygenase family protein [Gemmatimonadetes bacterium]|nr:phytanoyl-CoA dioxygenase family protein [Gemmatimonadota bacterium]MDE3259588.1 phytanoyl-CoA dioxygenase family protein [Gemmatimonadota bacterium]
MDNYERYHFDVNGFIVVEDILTTDEVAALNEAIDNNPDQVHIREGELRLSGAAKQHGGRAAPLLKGSHGRGDIMNILNWPKPWCQPFRDLLTQPRTMRYMLELIGDGFRYGNANGISMTAGAEGFLFHGGGTPRGPYYYEFQDGRMWNGLMAVCYQLTDINPGDGGFACIPGSHRANYACPNDVRRLDAHPEWFRHLPMKAGSALIFTEALTHGTFPWTASHERRTLLYRYGSGDMVFGSGPAIHPDGYESFKDELTPLQRALMTPPFASRRPSLVPLIEEEEACQARASGGPA